MSHGGLFTSLQTTLHPNACQPSLQIIIMVVVLLDPPHPWLLPLLLLLVLLEVAAAMGKRQWCQVLAKEVKELTIRKVEVMLQMNKVGAAMSKSSGWIFVPSTNFELVSLRDAPPFRFSQLHSWASPRTL